MPALQHVYVTAHGEWTHALWAGERAQFGVRLCIVPAASAPAKGETFTPPENGDPVPEFGTQAGTNGTLTKTWTARAGALGSLENFGAAEQIDVAEDVRKFLDATKGWFSNGFRWTHVKMAPISAAGATVGTASTYTFTTPVTGAASAGLPPQCAMALTMRANIVGRRGRGRIYLPALNRTLLENDATITPASAATIRGHFVTLINDLQNFPGWSTMLPIVSIMSAGSTQAVRPVEARTGSRVDTIKSRRAQVDEIYVSTAL